MSRTIWSKSARNDLVESVVEAREGGDTRWVVPVMALLFERKGEKFVALWRGLGASQGGIRAALSYTTERGWVERNPGYGHPMRPEYVLTKDGLRVGRACSQIIKALDSVPWKGLSKWSMAVLLVLMSGPCRFNELAKAAEGITDRALVMCLKPLVAHGLVARKVVETYPPTVTYSLTSAGRTVVKPIHRLASAMKG